MGFITAENVDTDEVNEEIPFAEVENARWNDEDRDGVVFEWNGGTWLMTIEDDYQRYQAEELVEPN